MDSSTNKEESIFEEAKTALKRLKQIAFSQKWKEYDQKPCKMYTMEIDGRVAARGDSIVNYSLEQILDFLADYKKIKNINPMIQQCLELERYSENLQVLYQTYGGMGPVSGRDFVLAFYRQIEGNKAYICSVSSQYPYPQAKGFIRGSAYIGGYVLEAIEAHKTKLTFLTDADIKGNIPDFVKREVNKRQGSIASKIEPIMKDLNYKI